MAYISWISDFVFYLEDNLTHENVSWNNESVLPNLWLQYKITSKWHIFQGPVILACTFKTTCIWCFNMKTWDTEWIWPIFELRITVGWNDLYFFEFVFYTFRNGTYGDGGGYFCPTGNLFELLLCNDIFMDINLFFWLCQEKVKGISLSKF